MPNLDWAGLSQKGKQKFGTYGEYYAKMEFASYGLDVYTSEVDDHGVDFVVRGEKGFYEIQVKSARLATGNVFMPKHLFDITSPSLYLCLLLFQQNRLPDLYLIPAADWQTETPLLRYYNYNKPGQSGQEEYKVLFSLKNLPLLEPYAFENMIGQL